MIFKTMQMHYCIVPETILTMVEYMSYGDMETWLLFFDKLENHKMI